MSCELYWEIKGSGGTAYPEQEIAEVWRLLRRKGVQLKP